MKKVIISLPEALLENVDELIPVWGFTSRAEFFRFAAINFIQGADRLMPADETLKEHNRNLNLIRRGQEMAEFKRIWIKENP